MAGDATTKGRTINPLQHFANMLPQRFLDLPGGFDLAILAKEKSGTAVFDFLQATASIAGVSQPEMRTSTCYRTWLLTEAERHGIPATELLHASMDVAFEVSEIEVKESFGHIFHSATFSLNASASCVLLRGHTVAGHPAPKHGATATIGSSYLVRGEVHNDVFKPSAENVARIIHTPSRSGGLTRRWISQRLASAHCLARHEQDCVLKPTAEFVAFIHCSRRRLLNSGVRRAIRRYGDYEMAEDPGAERRCGRSVPPGLPTPVLSQA